MLFSTPHRLDIMRLISVDLHQLILVFQNSWMKELLIVCFNLQTKWLDHHLFLFFNILPQGDLVLIYFSFFQSYGIKICHEFSLIRPFQETIRSITASPRQYFPLLFPHFFVYYLFYNSCYELTPNTFLINSDPPHLFCYLPTIQSSFIHNQICAIARVFYGGGRERIWYNYFFIVGWSISQVHYHKFWISSI